MRRISTLFLLLAPFVLFGSVDELQAQDNRSAPENAQARVEPDSRDTVGPSQKAVAGSRGALTPSRPNDSRSGSSGATATAQVSDVLSTPTRDLLAVMVYGTHPAANEPGDMTATMLADQMTVVHEWFDAVTYGQVTLADRDVVPDWIAHPDPCPSSLDAIVDQLLDAGWNPDDYRYVVLAGAPSPACASGAGVYQGIAFPSTDSVHVNDTDPTFTSGIAIHEIGHLLGLGHAQAHQCGPDATVLDAACTVVSERGDYWSVMGYGRRMGSLSTPHRSALGWLPSPDSITHVGVAPVEEITLEPVGRFGAQALGARLEQERTWWIEYRTPEDIDAGVVHPLSEAPAEPSVQVRIEPGPPSMTFPSTGLVAEVTAGESITFPGGTSMTVLSLSDTAVVRFESPVPCPLQADASVPDGEDGSLRWAIAQAEATSCDQVDVGPGTHLLTSPITSAGTLSLIGHATVNSSIQTTTAVALALDGDIEIRHLHFIGAGAAITCGHESCATVIEHSSFAGTGEGTALEIESAGRADIRHTDFAGGQTAAHVEALEGVDITEMSVVGFDDATSPVATIVRATAATGDIGLSQVQLVGNVSLGQILQVATADGSIGFDAMTLNQNTSAQTSSLATTSNGSIAVTNSTIGDNQSGTDIMRVASEGGSIELDRVRFHDNISSGGANSTMPDCALEAVPPALLAIEQGSEASIQRIGMHDNVARHLIGLGAMPVLLEQSSMHENQTSMALLATGSPVQNCNDAAGTSASVLVRNTTLRDDGYGPLTQMRAGDTLGLSYATVVAPNRTLDIAPSTTITPGATYLDVSACTGQLSTGLIGYVTTASCQRAGDLSGAALNFTESDADLFGSVYTPPDSSAIVDVIEPVDCQPVSDQRQMIRPQGPRCDIGAVEIEVQGGQALPKPLAHCALNVPITQSGAPTTVTAFSIIDAVFDGDYNTTWFIDDLEVSNEPYPTLELQEPGSHLITMAWQPVNGIWTFHECGTVVITPSGGIGPWCTTYVLDNEPGVIVAALVSGNTSGPLTWIGNGEVVGTATQVEATFTAPADDDIYVGITLVSESNGQSDAYNCGDVPIYHSSDYDLD